MKKRIVKKKIKKMGDEELFEVVAYGGNNRFRKIFEKEFKKRFEKVFKQEEQMSEWLTGVSHEVDELLK